MKAKNLKEALRKYIVAHDFNIMDMALDIVEWI
jgi:hypothetical protein